MHTKRPAGLVGLGLVLTLVLGLVFVGNTPGRTAYAVGGSDGTSAGGPKVTATGSLGGGWSHSVGSHTVVAKDGAVTLSSESHTQALTGFTAPTGLKSAKTTFIVADGQSGKFPGLTNNARFEGALLGGGDTLTGADGAATGNYLWDTENHGVSALVADGDTSVDTTVESVDGDCLTRVAQVFSVGPPDGSGGYVAAGAGLRNRGSGTINVAGIPAGAGVKKAYLYWAILNPVSPGGAMELNDVDVADVALASTDDPCWTAGNVWTFRADVTALVSGNGAYKVDGYPTGLVDNSDPWSNNVQPLAEGASLVVLWAMPSISPAEVKEVIFPGSKFEVKKTIQLPTKPPVLDFCLAVDNSGSYGDDIATIAGLAGPLWDDLKAGVNDFQGCLATFVDYPFNPWGSDVDACDDYAYKLNLDLTPTKLTWTTAVGAMVIECGTDLPESQYTALHQVAGGAAVDVPPAGPSLGDVSGPAPTWRAGAAHVVALTTDAAFHTPGDSVCDDPAPPCAFGYPGPTAAATLAALNAQNIKVIGLKAPGAAGELDALAAATGGAVKPTSASSDDIAAAILAAMDEITFKVEMKSDCTAPISTTFAPPFLIVPNGGQAVFTETISVAADAPGGTYTCKDWVLIDGEPMRNAAREIIYERKTILVPEGFVTGGGTLREGNPNSGPHANASGNVGFLADGTIVGQWQILIHESADNAFDKANFHSKKWLSLQFAQDGSDGPAPPPANANIAMFSAEGTLNGEPGWTMFTCLTDRGEPGKNDTLYFKLSNGVIGYASSDDFTPSKNDLGCGDPAIARAIQVGNYQIHAGVKALP